MPHDTIRKCMVMFFFLLACFTITHGMKVDDSIFLTAFGNTFALRDGSIVQTLDVDVVQRIKDLMTRQSIPLAADVIRALDNPKLVSLGMQAAVSGISPWRRDESVQDKIILHERSGVPEPEMVVGDMEIPIYLSIIGLMACTIILQHFQLNLTAARTATDKKE